MAITVEPPVKPEESLVEFVKRSHRELEAAGHKFMNDEEVTAWIDELRSDDNGSSKSIGRAPT